MATHRLFLRTPEPITFPHQIEATPTTTTPEENHDRSISSDRMAIADLRRANLRFSTAQYYKIAAPSVYDLARRIMSLAGMYPGFPLRVAKRDVASAFRLLRPHPALALAIVAGFPASHVNMDHDLVRFYLVIPFGWDVAPSHFARFGDAITRARGK